MDIEAKKRAIRDNIALKEVDEVPFVVEVGPVHLATAQYFNDDAAELKWNLDFHKAREGVYDYAFPHIKPNTGINIIASAFGCESKVNNEADPWVKCLITEDNAGDAFKLAVPKLDNPVFEKAFQRLEYLQSHSDLPLRALNVPSPLVTASLIWDYTSFITSLMIFPDEVHALLEKVTEATIAFVKEQFKRIKRLYSVGHEMWHIPPESGVRVSDDTAALLSPDLYREFGLKYNAMVSKEFGGIVVHSCGNVSNVAEAMVEIPGLKGLDYTIPQVENWEKVRDAVVGKVPLYLRHCYWDHLGNANVDMVAYTKKIVDFFGRKGIFIQTSKPTTAEAVAYSQELHKILSK